MTATAPLDAPLDVLTEVPEPPQTAAEVAVDKTRAHADDMDEYEPV